MRIAHISDLHLRQHLPGTAEISDRKSRLMAAALRSAVAQVRALEPDLMVVSGDLLDYPFGVGDEDEIRRLATQDLLLIQAILAKVTCPQVVLPGNHDLPDLVADVLGPPPVDQRLSGCRVVTYPEDAQDPDYVPHRVGDAWQRFERATSSSEPCTVHLQHYLIWPERSEGYPYNYARAEAMIDHLSRSQGQTLVLSGHYHEGIPLTRHRGVWYATAPALCEPPFSYWVYDLSESQVTWAAYQAEV